MPSKPGKGAAPAAPDPDRILVERARVAYTEKFAIAVEEALDAGGHFADFVRRSLARELDREETGTDTNAPEGL